MTQNWTAPIPSDFFPNGCRGWIASRPGHWSVHRLKYVASINDEALADNHDPTVEIQYVDIGSVSYQRGIQEHQDFVFEDAPSRARRIVRDGDVLVSTVRTYLRAIAAIADPPENLVASTGFAVVRPRRIDPGFLAYALSCPEFVEEIVSRSVGVSYPATNASEIADIPVPTPPREEQRAIAGFLDRETARIDALIAKKRRLIELLDEKRTALITRAVTKGLDPDAPMRDSGIEWLGEIPAHWVVRKVKHSVPKVTVGIVVNPSSYYVDDGVPCPRSLNVSTGKIRRENMVYISDEANELHAKSKIFEGDIVIVRTGKTGTAAIVPEWLDGCNCIDLVIVRKGTSISPEYLWYVLTSSIATLQAEQNSVGTIQAHFNVTTVGDSKYPFPPSKEQQSIVSFLAKEEARYDRIRYKVESAIDRLAEYRTALISAAVTGKINVAERTKPAS